MPLSGPPLANEGFVPLHRVLQKGLEARPDDIAFASALTRKTWRQLENESDNYARHLLSLGLKAGDRVATLMPNRCALLIITSAVSRRGWWRCRSTTAIWRRRSITRSR